MLGNWPPQCLPIFDYCLVFRLLLSSYIFRIVKLRQEKIQTSAMTSELDASQNIHVFCFSPTFELAIAHAEHQHSMKIALPATCSLARWVYFCSVRACRNQYVAKRGRSWHHSSRSVKAWIEGGISFFTRRLGYGSTYIYLIADAINTDHGP